MAYYDIVFIVLFSIIGIYFLRKVLIVNPKVKYSCKFTTSVKLVSLFVLIFGIISIVITLFTYRGVLDLIKTTLMCVVALIYILLKEGVGDDGVCFNGNFFPYSSIESYDYKMVKNDYKLYFVCKDKKDTLYLELTFNKNLKEVEKLIAEKLPKKYRRIKK